VCRFSALKRNHGGLRTALEGNPRSVEGLWRGYHVFDTRPPQRVLADTHDRQSKEIYSLCHTGWWTIHLYGNFFRAPGGGKDVHAARRSGGSGRSHEEMLHALPRRHLRALQEIRVSCPRRVGGTSPLIQEGPTSLFRSLRLTKGIRSRLYSDDSPSDHLLRGRHSG
jgi:hypothetical protein